MTDFPYPFPEDQAELMRLVNKPGISCCFSHYMVEGPIDEGTYYMCGECFHVFQTAQEMLADLNALLKRFDIEPFGGPAHEINSCPHCAHDF